MILIVPEKLLKKEVEFGRFQNGIKTQKKKKKKRKWREEEKSTEGKSNTFLMEVPSWDCL